MKRPLHIVAFGDSLTVGYQSPTPQNPLGKPAPYGPFLEKRSEGSIKVSVRGISGELTDDMVRRFKRDVIQLNPDNAVILGGTNDLGWGLDPQDIMNNLAAMYEAARNAGIRPVGVTVPSIRGFGSLIPARKALNRLITEFGRRHQQPVVDLFTATAEPETLRLAQAYSNDGLHLSTEGYRLLAELLYHEVFKALI